MARILTPKEWMNRVYGKGEIDYLEEDRPDVETMLNYMDNYGEYVKRKTKESFHADVKTRKTNKPKRSDFISKYNQAYSVYYTVMWDNYAYALERYIKKLGGK